MQSIRPLIVAADAIQECELKFGLPVELFTAAVTQGWLERQTKLTFHAKNVPGSSFQSETFASLNRLAVEHGWIAKHEGSFASILSPDGRLAIAVKSASDRTGLGPLRPFPRCNNRNGAMLHNAVRQNQQNHPGLDLFTPDVIPIMVDTVAGGIDTHLLLIHVDRSGGPTHGQIRSELSLPTIEIKETRSHERKLRIVGWVQRILFPAITPDRGRTRPERTETVEVQIMPKAG